MARKPEVFVRAVSMAEGQRLQRIGRTAKDPVKLRRAIVVLMAAQGQPAPDIAHLLNVSADYVRGVIHAFNERGFDALGPNGAGVVLPSARRAAHRVGDTVCEVGARLVPGRPALLHAGRAHRAVDRQPVRQGPGCSRWRSCWLRVRGHGSPHLWSGEWLHPFTVRARRPVATSVSLDRVMGAGPLGSAALWRPGGLPGAVRSRPWWAVGR